MKTNLFMALAFAFLMLFAACTEEKIIYVEKENGIEVLPGEGVIKIILEGDPVIIKAVHCIAAA